MSFKFLTTSNVNRRRGKGRGKESPEIGADLSAKEDFHSLCLFPKEFEAICLWPASKLVPTGNLLSEYLTSKLLDRSHSALPGSHIATGVLKIPSLKLRKKQICLKVMSFDLTWSHTHTHTSGNIMNQEPNVCCVLMSVMALFWMCFINVHTHTYSHIHIPTYIHTYAYIHLHIHACMHACAHTHTLWL